MSNSTRQPAALNAALLTPNQPGAIAIVQLNGTSSELESCVEALTGAPPPSVSAMRLATFRDDAGNIDEGLVVRVDSQIIHLMPHGGMRVMQRLLGQCAAVGAQIQQAGTLPARALYPEADDDVDALMLAALAKSRSPLAIELLLDQPNRWTDRATLTEEDSVRSHRLNRLIDPPLVVLTGPANVGKSTLSNALLGWTMSIAVNQPGTTRDYTAGLIDLKGVVVHWHDTPGLRDTDDPIEREAIELARNLMQQADLLVAMTDHEHDWPALPRSSDLRIACKCDIAQRGDADLNISNTTGTGITALVETVRDLLVPPADLQHPGRWLFDERLLH